MRFSLLIVPRLSLRDLLQSLRWAVLGGLLAGAYGMVHDSITFRIGPDYFYLLKFEQFAWADLGLSRPLFAMEIGFLASWAVGLCACYLLARVQLQRHGKIEPKRMLKSIGIMLAGASLSAVAAGLIGSRWAEEEFQQVAWIHNSSYAGAALGLLLGLRLCCRKSEKLSSHNNAQIELNSQIRQNQ